MRRLSVSFRLRDRVRMRCVGHWTIVVMTTLVATAEGGRLLLRPPVTASFVLRGAHARTVMTEESFTLTEVLHTISYLWPPFAAAFSADSAS